ncbi:MAG: TspO/MBR family protein [Patescibacteria group bacterium]
MKLNYFIIPIITIFVATLGSYLTSQGMDWYKSINLPSWTPPGSVIGAVWTLIFILGTISALIFFNKAEHNSLFNWIIIVFIINAFLNVFWSYLFFYLHLISPAIFEAATLGASVVILIILIWPISRLAASLLIPYASWVMFATYLTYSVWIVNK